MNNPRKDLTESELEKSKSLSYLEYEIDPMDDFYEHPILGVISRMRLNQILKKLRGFEDVVILDVGCEAGFLTMRLTDIKGATVVPFDICKYAISDFHKKIRDSNNNGILNPMVASTYYTPVKTNSVDVVVCSEVVQLLPSIEGMFEEFYRVLREGGTLVFTYGTQTNRRKFFPILKLFRMDTDTIEKTFGYHHTLEDIKSVIKDKFIIKETIMVPSRFFPIATILILESK